MAVIYTQFATDFRVYGAAPALRIHARSGFRRPVPPILYSSYMKARVFVSFKPTVLDPQGQTIRGALNSLGHSSIAAVRQGKFFDIEIAPGAAREQVQREMDQVARDVLANPVIEDYSIEFSD